MPHQPPQNPTPEQQARHDRRHPPEGTHHPRTPYPGPYLDGNAASGMDIAYVDLKVGGTGAVVKIFRPYPPATKIDEILGGNGPSYVLDAALADGSYAPSAELLAAAKAFADWQASR